MDELLVVINTFTGVISVVVAIIVAMFVFKTLKVYRQQVRVGQDQVKISQDQMFNQSRPVLVPPTDMSSLLRDECGTLYIKWGIGQQTMKGLQNIGLGPAFNIYGMLFGEEFQSHPPTERHVIWNYGILAPGTTGEDIVLSQGSGLDSDTVIGEHVLYVPDDVEHINRIVRLTLTYHDIYGRKFASMYDYQRILGWMNIGHFEIEQDLYELDKQTPMIQQSNQFFYQSGKISAP